MWGFSLRGMAYIQARFRTYNWLWRNRAIIRQQHALIQVQRRVPDQVLLQGSLESMPFDQLIGGKIDTLTNALLKPIYKLLRPHL